jgi:hypothetical protein
VVHWELEIVGSNPREYLRCYEFIQSHAIVCDLICIDIVIVFLGQSARQTHAYLRVSI